MQIKYLVKVIDGLPLNSNNHWYRNRRGDL